MPRLQRTIDWLPRFWSKVNKLGPIHPVLKTRCWIWTGTTSGGYGYFRLNGKMQRASRVAWFITYGNWPTRLACHHCDNTSCVRPIHLFDGTRRDNANDMVQKGRIKDRSGSTNGHSRLVESQVLEILALYKLGKTMQIHLAESYGVSVKTINHIVHGLSWKHVQPTSPA